MDPLSVTASAISVVGLLSQSCLFVSDFFRNFSDAPVDIKHHHMLYSSQNFIRRSSESPGLAYEEPIDG